MQNIIEDLRHDLRPEQIKAIRGGEVADLGLVNQFRLHQLLPNKWFDWENRQHAQIVIIGQDWGPYVELKKYVDRYETEKDKVDFDYNKFLFESFSSRTEKFIIKAIEQTFATQYGKFDPNVYNQIMFTMAVLFTRQGIHFRGNHNFDPVQSMEISYPYIKRQLDIVKPKIIMPLGGLAFDEVKRYFDLDYADQTLTEVINSLPQHVIQTRDTIVIPNFHPASHTDPKQQLEIWSQIWKYYN